MDVTIGQYTFSILDIGAFLWFLCLVISFHYYADYSGKNATSLHGASYAHYRRWMNEVVARPNRLVDARILASLLDSVRFFASTAILILAGLVTMLGYGKKGMAVINSLPFAVTDNNLLLWEIKTLLLILIFIYSFFKCTWAIRQYSYVCMLVGGVPTGVGGATAEHYAEYCAKLITNAARHSHLSIRAYYFGLALLSWFVHPVLFIFTSTWVIAVLYRREFRSRVLQFLTALN